jgi:peptide-methionine (S)-S-oxide reductase
VFSELRGVSSVVSGYAGGHVVDPTYEQVCRGTTGHAEVVQISFDPAQISFETLLEVFFAVHDPTTPNRQGADVGPQYRSLILYENDEQRQASQQVIDRLTAAGKWADPIVTEITALGDFYPAEPYHQDYYRRNARQPYCRVVIDPKLAQLRAGFAELRRDA